MTQTVETQSVDTVPWWAQRDDRREFEQIPVRQLTVDSAEQRNTPPERPARLGTEWDWRKAEVPTVSRIEGADDFRVLEGQTRVLARMLVDPDGWMWCAVIPETTPRERASVALGISTGRRSFSAIEKWNQRVRSGGAYELAATNALARLGLRMGTSAATTTIACPGTISMLIHGGRRTADESAALLEQTMSVLVKAYPDYDPDSRLARFSPELIRAVFEIIIRNLDVADMERLASRMKQRSAALWVRDAIDPRRQRFVVIGEGVIDQYNSRLSPARRLSWTR